MTNAFVVTDSGKVICTSPLPCRERFLGPKLCDAMDAPMINGGYVCRFTPSEDSNLYPCGREITEDKNPDEEIVKNS